MGLKLCKYYCCCCCCNCTAKTNSVGVATERRLKVLLLGLGGSGKTELGHRLSHRQRLDYEPTNGTQYYELQLPERLLCITEIGGNAEMQKVWHHYFVTTMGIIYCFDMSASYEQLQLAFECLRRTLMHPCVRGKPVLLVAAKSDLVDEGVQLYDIENAFQLEALASYYACSVHLCCAGGDTGTGTDSNTNTNTDANADAGASGVLAGVGWLVQFIIDNVDMLKLRIRCDSNMQTWQQQVNKLIADGRIKRGRYQRLQQQWRNARRRKWNRSLRNFRSRRIRPHTAPAIISTTPYKLTNSTVVASTTQSMPNGHITPVPNTNESPSMTLEPFGKVTEV